ncbi:MAG: histidine phosphatase family protein [Myxococcales bacterium]|nr:histidine phosphatase family protein [Myxococcales bacterium]
MSESGIRADEHELATGGLRRLVIMRHAKSALDMGADGDHARPLNDRGRRDAPRMACRLRELGWVPERVVSSDSRRTRETWALMQAELGEVPSAFIAALYLGGVAPIRAALATLGDEVKDALVLGHNPGCEEAVRVLAGIEATLGTAAAVLLSVAAPSWREAVRLDGQWRCEGRLDPRDLG